MAELLNSFDWDDWSELDIWNIQWDDSTLMIYWIGNWEMEKASKQVPDFLILQPIRTSVEQEETGIFFSSFTDSGTVACINILKLRLVDISISSTTLQDIFSIR